MSRYYQSSYHGSNDYKKYRQERLKANDSKLQTTFKSSYKQDLTSYKTSSALNNKEHLQTFGKQNKMLSYGTILQLGRSPDPSLKSKYQNYSSQQMSFNGKYQSKYKPRERDYTLKSNSYLIDRQTKITPSYQQTSDFKNIQDQSYQNISRQRANSSYSKYESVIENFAKDNFEDSVISRKKDYGYQNVERNVQMERSIKNYNYSAKVNNLYQRCDQDKINEDKNCFYRKQTDFNRKFGERNYLNSAQYQARENTPSYQSRNQLIKQRLNLNSNNQSSSNTSNMKSNFKQPSQQDFDTKVPGFSSRYVSTHTTPQKSQLASKDDENLSQQRRKSLIEKSQMLKQKLNKLNTSSSKLKQNQENQQEPIRLENSSRNQIMTSQGYTPPKKLTSYSLKQNQENQELTEKSVSKKLDFDRDLQTERNFDTTLKESNRNTSRNYMRSYQKQNIEDSTLAKNSFSATKNLLNQESGDGALKKIQQLNERINSRLQSILKNYG